MILVDYGADACHITSRHRLDSSTAWTGPGPNFVCADKLIATADGDLGLVHEALCACSTNGDGGDADINAVINYIITDSLVRKERGLPPRVPFPSPAADD